jgi:fructose 1,6-bisphosphatase
MDKEIVLKNERLKKLVGWLEKKSLPMRALILTASGFLALGVIFSAFAIIYLVLGLVGLFAAIMFTVAYVLLLSAML